MYKGYKTLKNFSILFGDYILAKISYAKPRFQTEVMLMDFHSNKMPKVFFFTSHAQRDYHLTKNGLKLFLL
jgi:hypothetical protein